MIRGVPTVLRIDGYDFHFFANEGEEPPHIHVDRAEFAAKFWLDPVSLVWSNFRKHSEHTRLTQMVVENQALLLEAWFAFHPPQKKKGEKN
jgi:hypothetical protein